jgi:hypothetical protein
MMARRPNKHRVHSGVRPSLETLLHGAQPLRLMTGKGTCALTAAQAQSTRAPMRINIGLLPPNPRDHWVFTAERARQHYKQEWSMQVCRQPRGQPWLARSCVPLQLPPHPQTDGDCGAQHSAAPSAQGASQQLVAACCVLHVPVCVMCASAAAAAAAAAIALRHASQHGPPHLRSPQSPGTSWQDARVKPPA